MSRTLDWHVARNVMAYNVILFAIKWYQDMVTARDTKISVKLTLSHASSSLQLQECWAYRKIYILGAALCSKMFFPQTDEKCVGSNYSQSFSKSVFPIVSWVVMNLFILSALILQMEMWIFLLVLWYGSGICRYSFVGTSFLHSKKPQTWVPVLDWSLFSVRLWLNQLKQLLNLGFLYTR